MMSVNEHHQSGSAPPHEESSGLISDDAIPEASPHSVLGVEELYLDLQHDCLSQDNRLACVQIAELALDPCQQESAKAQLIALHLSASGNSIGNKECENLAEAWIHAAKARRAVDEGHGAAAQTFIDSAYTLLTANMKLQAHRRLFDRKTKCRQECIEEFAKLVRAKRPTGGWTDHSAVAKALDRTLAIIIDQKKRESGPLWRKDPAALIIEWLARKKGPVYEAYRGRGS
jgi:hypothetical protein